MQQYESDNKVFSEIDRIFELQKSYKYAQRNTTCVERLRKLSGVKKIVQDSRQEICDALAADFRKPEVEVELTEILPVISMINLLESELQHWMQPHHHKTPFLLAGTSGWVEFVAKGNCLIISPWNYPFHLCMYPVLTAIAAGNTCMIKPSEYTPATNKIISKILEQIFEEKEIAMFEGEAEVSTYLLNKPFDHIFFTGSTPVGKIVMAHAAKHLASVGLELGGKSPAVIDPEADLKNVANKLIWGKLVNSGQTCVAPDYILIRDDKKDELVSLLKKNIQDFYPQGDFENNPDYSLIITERHANRLKHLVDEAVDKGAKLECGGELIGDGRVLTPTILSSVDKSMEVMQDEIFGPVLPIVTYKSESEIVEYINSFDNALAMYIFSKRKSFYQPIIDNTSNGGVTINDNLIALGNPHLPFGGAGKSGIGKYHGRFGFEEFSNMRTVVKRNIDLGASYFYPPYSQKKVGLLKTVMKRLSSFF